MKSLIKNIRSQRGVTMIEYAILAALIAVAAIAAVTNLGQEIVTTFQAIKDALLNSV